MRRTGGAIFRGAEEPTPYRVLVSEFMLQQTQVDRVIPAFERFVAQFPDFAVLAGASRADVVRAWRGLGYNSRAVRLHELARAIRDRHAGELPRDESSLRALPGVGPYTVRAIRAFAFGEDVVAIDTNVRRIVHRMRFGLEFPPKAAAVELDRVAAEFDSGRRRICFQLGLDGPRCDDLHRARAEVFALPAAIRMRRGAARGRSDRARVRGREQPPRSSRARRNSNGRRAICAGGSSTVCALCRRNRAISLLDLQSEFEGSSLYTARGFSRTIGRSRPEGLVERSEDGLQLRR